MVEGRTLFIRNLPFIVTEEELQDRYVFVFVCYYHFAVAVEIVGLCARLFVCRLEV